MNVIEDVRNEGTEVETEKVIEEEIKTESVAIESKVLHDMPKDTSANQGEESNTYKSRKHKKNKKRQNIKNKNSNSNKIISVKSILGVEDQSQTYKNQEISEDLNNHKISPDTTFVGMMKSKITSEDKIAQLEQEISKQKQEISDLKKQNAHFKNQGKISDDVKDDKEELLCGTGQGSSETCVR